MTIQTPVGAFRVIEVRKKDGPIRCMSAKKEGEEGTCLLWEVVDPALARELLPSFLDMEEKEEEKPADFVASFLAKGHLWAVFRESGEPFLFEEQGNEPVEEPKKTPEEMIQALVQKGLKLLLSHRDTVLKILYTLAVVALWGVFVYVLIRPAEAPAERNWIAGIGELSVCGTEVE